MLEEKQVDYCYPTSPDATKFKQPLGCFCVAVSINKRPAISVSAHDTEREAIDAAEKLPMPWGYFWERKYVPAHHLWNSTSKTYEAIPTPQRITLAEFKQMYTEELTKAVTDHPEEYHWPISDVPVVVERMVAAVARQSYNKDSRALKAVCKRLGIKHTYTAIQEAIQA